MKSARLFQKYNHIELAGKLGVTSTMIGRYERDEQRPSLEKFAKLTQILKLNKSLIKAMGALRR